MPGPSKLEKVVDPGSGLQKSALMSFDGPVWSIKRHEVEGPSKDMRFLGPTKDMRFVGPSKNKRFQEGKGQCLLHSVW